MSVQYVVILVLLVNFCYGQESCESKETCNDCIQQLGCVWCTLPRINPTVHCINEKSVVANWCLANHRVSTTSGVKIIQNIELSSDSDSPVQIKPQKFKIKLRKGEKIDIEFQYEQAKNYPVDLYYIMDLSASMLPHKNKLGKLGLKLADTMRNITNNFRLGFGSFVDKTELPFVNTHPNKIAKPCRNCVSAYSFHNHMTLTEDYKKFSIEVNKANISGNIDSPEGGFDALMQAIVCKKDIGWRSQARHLMVFSTDASFHIAGDGKLGGIVEPNDAKCHMTNNSYTHSLIYDYPSISQINYFAKLNNINLIFAVVKINSIDTIESYKRLSTLIENSNMGVLESNSNNVVKLVLDNYNKIVDSVTLTTNATDDIAVTINPSCKYKKENGCTNVHVGEIINFTATITALSCSPKYPTKKFISINPEALNESVIVELDIDCYCDCASAASPSFKAKAPECSFQGNLECGICKCFEERFGRQCQCDSLTGSSSNATLCQKSPDQEVCSGSGECKCGKCECFPQKNPEEIVDGKYCECDNYSCLKENDMLCNGKGTCECGKCKCSSGWLGDSCNCRGGKKTCIAPLDNEDVVCSNQGKCICGQCVCDVDKNGNRYSGQWCSDCPLCPAARCEELRNCVECQAFGTELYKEEDCKTNCTTFTTMTVDEFPQTDGEDVKECSAPDKEGCKFTFRYTYDNDQVLTVVALKKKSCKELPDVLAWVAAVVITIVLAGFIALIIWKICTTVHDRREYAKFETERQRLKWSRNDNPLYRQAVTTFSNPAYNTNRTSKMPTKS